MSRSKTMKIGFDVAQTCETRAGCAWYADALIHAMTDLEPRHEYYLYHRFGRWKHTRPEGGTRIEKPGVHHPFATLGEAESAALLKKVSRGQAALPGDPDVVQSNSFQAPEVGPARLVVVVHDVSFWAHPEFTTETNRLTCQRGVCDALYRADGLIFVSESSHSEFERMLPGWLEENRVPYAAIPLASRIAAESVAGAKAGDYWLAVGSIEPRKNYETLLDALELYWKRSARRIPLYIAGGRGWRNHVVISRMEALEQAGLVRVMGYVDDALLPGLYQGARALVFPSWYEGFGLPVLEAMQSGCPVICSNRTSLEEIGGDAVSRIDPARAESICEAMLRMEADDALRHGLAEAGKRQAARYSWERAARQTLDFYDEVLTRPPRSAKRWG